MAQQTDNFLKSKFLTGSKPTQQDFTDFIDSKARKDVANTSVDGLMTSSDKVKLDEFSTANTYALQSDLDSISVANSTVNGFMSSSDKTKLDEFSTANTYALQSDLDSIANTYTTLSYFEQNNSMSTNEKINFNNLLIRQAQDDYNNTRTALDYKGGFYDIFADESKIWDVVTPAVGYNLGSASYDGIFFNGLYSQGSDGSDIRFNNDGTKLYYISDTNDQIYQYSLSTAFDITTITYDSVSFSVASQTTSIGAFTFNGDGTKFYVTSFNTIYQYSLSTAFDISSATYDSVSFSTASQSTGTVSINFNADGSKFLIININNDTIYQYSCGTNFDISTASYDSVSFSVTSQETAPRSLMFNSDGSKMFVIGNGSNTIYQYSLPTAYTLSSATYDSVSFSVTAQVTTSKAILSNSNGTRMYVFDSNNGRIYQYITETSEIVTKNITNLTVSTLDGGDPNGKVELQEDIVGSWDVTTATFDGTSFSVSAQETSPHDIAFKPDGTKMYIVGTAGDDVNPYTLGTPWDVTTATFDGTPFSVAAQDTSPTGIAFKPDGTKMYIVGASGDDVNPYTLSTAWDVTTATFDGTSFSVSAQETNPYGIAFKPDGTKMYIVGNSGDDVNPYTLSTPWDVTTASFDGTPFSVAAQETSPHDIAFKPDGTKMYIVGIASKAVSPYTLSTAWDVTTATFDGTSFSVSAQETNPRGIAFKPDGTKMYVLGLGGRDVNPYTVGVDNGFFTLGNFVTTSIDLTSDLSASPTKVVVSSEFATPTDTTLSVTISDGTNDVTITSANFDTEVDCSALTSRTLTATWNLATTDTTATPTIDNYALYFS